MIASSFMRAVITYDLKLTSFEALVYLRSSKETLAFDILLQSSDAMNRAISVNGACCFSFPSLLQHHHHVSIYAFVTTH